MVTIRDVAAAAGVSTSTVSRVLDDRLPASRSAAAARVRRAAAELGYRPDPSAASLRRGSTATIGVVVPRLTDTVMAMLYEALVSACARSHRYAVVATTDDVPDADREAAELLLSRRVDGLVLATARRGSTLPEELTRRGVPYVLALRTDGKSLSSVGDDALGGYLATRHLLDLGHRRIGLIAGPDHASSARGRQVGYRQALLEAGIEPDERLVQPSAFGIESGVEACRALLAVQPAPTAVFAVNDNTAVGALSALVSEGLSVPDDVSLVGYNDIPIARRLPVPLSTVRVPFDEIAAAALDLLLRPLAAGEPRLRVAAPTLIPRGSSAPPQQFRMRQPPRQATDRVRSGGTTSSS